MEIVLITKNEFNYKQAKFIDVVVDSDDNITITYFKSNLTNSDIETAHTDADYTKISSVTFPISDISAITHSYAIYFNNMGNLTAPIDNTKYITSSRNGFGILQVMFGINDSNPIIYLNSNAEKLCILCYPPIRNSNVAFTIRAKNEIPNDVWIDEFGEAFSSKVSVAKARRTLLIESDPNNSLSYIEAQLDILTKIVFSIYDNCTADQQAAIQKVVPAFGEFRTLIDSHSVLTIKSEVKCLEELSNGKAKIREFQSDYYTAKSSV